MKKELSTRADIELLVNEFYKKAPKDELIGHFFTEVVQLSLEEHMPKMYSFWESVLFGKATYRGNPMTPHIMLDQQSRMELKHFVRWRELWGQMLDEYFIGEKAEEAKKKAEQMALLMQFKIQQSRMDGFIQ